MTEKTADAMLLELEYLNHCRRDAHAALIRYHLDALNNPATYGWDPTETGLVHCLTELLAGNLPAEVWSTVRDLPEHDREAIVYPDGLLLLVAGRADERQTVYAYDLHTDSTWRCADRDNYHYHQFSGGALVLGLGEVECPVRVYTRINKALETGYALH